MELSMNDEKQRVEFILHRSFWLYYVAFIIWKNTYMSFSV
jgi:hypothetical protein